MKRSKTEFLVRINEGALLYFPLIYKSLRSILTFLYLFLVESARVFLFFYSSIHLFRRYFFFISFRLSSNRTNLGLNLIKGDSNIRLFFFLFFFSSVLLGNFFLFSLQLKLKLTVSVSSPFLQL